MVEVCQHKFFPPLNIHSKTEGNMETIYDKKWKRTWKKQPMQKLAPLQTGLTFIVCYICKTPHINPQSSAGSAKYGIPLGFASKDKSSDIPQELKSTCPGSVNTKLVVNETYSPKRWFHCDESRGIIRIKPRHQLDKSKMSGLSFWVKLFSVAKRQKKSLVFASVDIDFLQNFRVDKNGKESLKKGTN